MSDPSDVFESDSLLSRCLDDASLAAKVLERFESNAESMIDDLRAAMDAADADAVARAAHVIRGVAANVSCDELASSAGAMEDHVRGQGLTMALLEEVEALAATVHRARAAVPEVIAAMQRQNG
ncbi:MAG: Hpt domain-containing protein [Phycisphaerales bacterium]